MAQVKLDISEYEALKQNAEDLRESLKVQKEQANKIEELQKEKIQAYKDAEKKVVYLRKQETHETILVKKDAYKTFERLKMLFASINENGSILRNSTEDAYYINNVIESCFDKTTSISMSDEDTLVETKGLDKVKDKLRADIKSKLDKKIQMLLEKESEIQDADEKIKKANKLADKYIIENCELTKRIDELIEENKKESHKFNTMSSSFLTFIENIRSYNLSKIFSSSTLDELIRTADNKRMEIYKENGR